MSNQTAQTKEPASFDGCVIGYDYDEPTHVIYDSRHTARATATRLVAAEYGIEFAEATCTTVYCRWLTPIEIWQDHGAGEHWWDNQGEMVGGQWVPADDDGSGPPDEPVEGWEPDAERDPSFELCGATADGAIKCWKVATGL